MELYRLRPCECVHLSAKRRLSCTLGDIDKAHVICGDEQPLKKSSAYMHPPIQRVYYSTLVSDDIVLTVLYYGRWIYVTITEVGPRGEKFVIIIHFAHECACNVETHYSLL